jgi:hypothetical protein
MRTPHAAVGGPNVPPPDGGIVAEAVTNAPGAPIHVLLTDDEAEHIPGCNMVFRREALEAIGGFDPQFRTAGDDVDVCWRLKGAGWTIGFNAAAMVWHRRRDSIRAYWRQQRGYGHAEALLERKWPEKYNGLGHFSWTGRVYSNGPRLLRWRRGRVYQGLWGSAPFQSLYQPAPSTLASILDMPEWWFVVIALAGTSLLGALWAPLLWARPFLVVTLGVPLVRAIVIAWSVPSPRRQRPFWERLALCSLTAWLHLLQPIARLRGRLANGLTPARLRAPKRLVVPRSRVVNMWSERWREPLERVAAVEAALRAAGVPVRRGGAYDRWDLEVPGGMLGATRMLMVVEEHGAGTQFVRARIWSYPSWPGLGLALTFGALALGAWLDGVVVIAVALAVGAVTIALRASVECATTSALFGDAVRHTEPSEDR